MRQLFPADIFSSFLQKSSSETFGDAVLDQNSKPIDACRAIEPKLAKSKFYPPFPKIVEKFPKLHEIHECQLRSVDSRRLPEFEVSPREFDWSAHR